MQRGKWGYLGLGLWLIGLSGCGTDSPTATNPINNNITSVRTMTPQVKPFSELDDDQQPISESLIATFVITPEQLAEIQQRSTALTPQTLGSCTECASDPDPQPSQDRQTKRIGTYEVDDLRLQLQLNLPESSSVGRVQGSVRFQIDSTTQFLNPGYGAQLKILRATLQDASDDPQQQVEATALSDPVDFPEKEITKGQSSTRSIALTFGQVPFDSRYLRLQVLLTSPIPNRTQAGQATAPPEGQLYSGLWLGSDLDLSQASAHQEDSGQASAWIGWRHEWNSAPSFPLEQAMAVRSQGSVPYLHLIWPESGEAAAAIRSGEQDEAIRAWGEAIRAFKTPVILAVGPTAGVSEATEDAPPIYRYGLDLLHQQQIPNLTWVYQPDLEAEDLSQGYPGDTQVDWIGLPVSVDPDSGETFQTQLDQIYPRVAALSARRPILLTALGFTRPPQAPDQMAWLEGSLLELLSKRWPRVIGFAWDRSVVSLQDTPGAVEIWQETIAGSEAVLGQVQIKPLPPPPTGSPSQPSPGSTPVPSPTVPNLEDLGQDLENDPSIAPLPDQPELSSPPPGLP